MIEHGLIHGVMQFVTQFEAGLVYGALLLTVFCPMAAGAIRPVSSHSPMRVTFERSIEWLDQRSRR